MSHPPSVWQRARARFDVQALRPPDCRRAAAPGAGRSTPAGHAPDHPGAAAPDLSTLERWCRQAGPAGPAPWAEAWWPGPAPAGEAERQHAIDTAAHLACRLDGSLRLATLGRAAGLAWRLQVKLQDLMPGRSPHPADPWDSGWARPEAADWLARGFEPRRTTLLLADAAELHRLGAAAQALAARAPQLQRPLRWLWIGPAALGSAPGGSCLRL